jgi:PAS domain S-box-containing protein
VPAEAALILVIADADESTALKLLRVLRKHGHAAPILVLGPPPPGNLPSRYLAEGATDHIRWPAAGGDLAIRLGAHIERSTGRAAAAALTRAERALSHQDKLFEEVLAISPEAVVVADEAGRVVHFNGAAETLLGYRAEDATRQCHASDFYADPADRERFLAEMKASDSGQVDGMALRLRASNGNIVPVRAWGAGLRDSDGRLITTATIFRDLRERLSLSTRLEQATKQLVQVEKRAATAAVAGATAHELNQPLTVAMGLLEILASQPTVDDDMRDRIDQVYHQLDRIAEIVRQLSNVTQFRTTDYIGQDRILDLDGE